MRRSSREDVYFVLARATARAWMRGPGFNEAPIASPGMAGTNENDERAEYATEYDEAGSRRQNGSQASRTRGRFRPWKDVGQGPQGPDGARRRVSQGRVRTR